LSDTEKLTAEAMTLAGDVDASFIRLGQILRQLQDKDEAAYLATVRYCCLPTLVATDLVRIDRAFAALPVPAARLKRIGWIKLAALAPYVSKENYPALLKQAEMHDEAALGPILRGAAPADLHVSVTFRLREDERTMLNTVLLSFGAVETEGGVANQEAALMDMAWFVQQQLEGFPIKDEEGDEKIDFINLDAELAWVERKVTTTLEDRLERMIKVLAKVRAERDSLQDRVNDLTGQLSRAGINRQSEISREPDSRPPKAD